MTWCLDWILTVMSIKLQNQVKEALRARRNDTPSYLLHQKQCLPSNYLTQKNRLVTTFIMPQNKGCKSIIEGKKKHNLMGDHYLLSLTAPVILPFRADLLENSSPWWQGFCTRVKTKHPSFWCDGRGKSYVVWEQLLTRCPLGQISLDPHGRPSRISSVGARHWAGTGCCTWKTQSSHCISAS